jgi:hypothetical protein
VGNAKHEESVLYEVENRSSDANGNFNDFDITTRAIFSAMLSWSCMTVEQLLLVSCTPSLAAVTACVNGDIRDGLR